MVGKHTDNYWQASLEAREGDLNRDVVIVYRLQRPRTGLDLISSKQGGEDGYFLLTLTAGPELEAASQGADYVFVLDVSGSMAHDGKLGLSRGSIKEFMEALEEGDRAELLTFNITQQALFGTLQPANAETKARAEEFLRSQRAAGGTSLMPAVEAAYRYRQADRPLNVVVLSDGMTEQQESAQLMQLIAQRPAGVTVFCVGIGNEVNRPLLTQIAHDAGGLASFISTQDDFARQAEAFRRKLVRPAASNVKITFAGGDVYDLEPLRTTDPRREDVRAHFPGSLKTPAKVGECCLAQCDSGLSPQYYQSEVRTMITPARRRAVFCAVALILSSTASWSPAYGDSWGPPQKEHWSANKRFVLQVEYPEPKSLSLCEKTDDGLKQHWTRGYVDPVWPPLRAYVTNDGKYVVLRDVYHNVGYGKVIVILGDGGKINGSYELADFLSQGEIQSAKHTVSSLSWSENAWFSFLNDERQFALATQEGTIRCFDLPSGKLLDLSDDKRAVVVDLVRKDAESWLATGSVSERIQGITLLGALQIEGAIPDIKRLFQDKTPFGSVFRSDKPSAEVYGVQRAAALVLVRLIGAEAIPFIEAELPQANWYMKEELTRVLDRLEAKPDKVGDTSASTAVKGMWLRLAGSPDADLRYFALCQVLRRDDGTFLRQHPELIESESEAVRSAAVARLPNVASSDALSLLRKAMVDKQGAVRHSAIKQFIVRQPADIVEGLLPYLNDDYAPIRADVICELACWGHPSAIATLRETIAAWPNADLKGIDKWEQRSEIETFCKLIADLKLHEVRDSLVAGRSVRHVSPRTAVIGALAALGDSQAISDLHRIASGGDGGDRVCAVQMCRYLSDAESAALVKEAAEDSFIILQGAATGKLRRFPDKRKTPPVP